LVSSEIHIRKKGQMTLPAELREKFGVRDGDRIIGEYVDGKIILTRPEDIVKRTAGIFAKYAKDGPVEINRDDIWGEIADDRDNRLRQQVAEESGSYDPD
jgi:AbrB family looped-hinge helix DNA binding protein